MNSLLRSFFSIPHVSAKNHQAKASDTHPDLGVVQIRVQHDNRVRQNKDSIFVLDLSYGMLGSYLEHEGTTQLTRFIRHEMLRKGVSYACDLLCFSW